MNEHVNAKALFYQCCFLIFSIKQAEIATKLKLSQSYVSRVINGERNNKELNKFILKRLITFLELENEM